jgi:hypothetical protein
MILRSTAEGGHSALAAAARKATEAAFCTFNVRVPNEVLDALRKAKASLQIIVGIPAEVRQAETVMRSLYIGLESYPQFTWRTMANCHAKYYLFRSKDEWTGFIGSMNLTSGGQQLELLLECSPEQVEQILRRHKFLFRLSTEHKATPRNKLDKAHLSGLLSTPVGH